ncbi:glycosyltransferase family 4 protein [Chitinophaga deserti]|uniref:glycosyltransferase family 4 protein n=1 Tax=Chitinophaga deserti TaxID=2164099 RepID=UPI000D6A7EAA|nr:glycosyltransferase family 4 protein [Chitinophaga deserti]
MKLLLIGQFAQQTGMARITQLIARGLSTRHDVHVLGVDAFSKEPFKGTFTLHYNPHPNDVFGESVLPGLIDQLQPDAILLYCDIWFAGRYTTAIRQAAHRCHVAGYIPVDGGLNHADFAKGLAQLDSIVAFTNFGKRVLKDCATQLGLSRRQPFRNMAVIPHPLDGGRFYPLPGTTAGRRIAAREALFPGQDDLRRGFWVLNANKNQHRKRIDLTLRGFAAFARNKPENVRLCLHMATKGLETEVEQQARLLGISGRLVLTDPGRNHPHWPTEKLNLLYNACDVGINTAMGEGWGLVSMEHAATGAPQIVPDHTACSELWKGSAALIPAKPHTYGNGWLTGGLVEPNGIAAQLERLYEDSGHYHHLLQAGIRNATQDAWSQESIANMWEQHFEQILLTDHANIH